MLASYLVGIMFGNMVDSLTHIELQCDVTVKPGFYVPEGCFWYECKIRALKIYVAIDIWYAEVILP
jgi:hypothetical protein